MKHNLFGVEIDDISDEQLNKTIEGWLIGQSKKVIVTPNAEFLLKARRDPWFKKLLNRSDLAVPDTVSLRYAVAALSTDTLANRRPGVNLLEDLCAHAIKADKGILLLGGEDNAAEQAAFILATENPGLHIEGLDPGILNQQGSHIDISENLSLEIERIQPDIVAVALGQGKQEIFMHQAKDLFPFVQVWIGVGGAFEMISGQKSRAPEILQKYGLEWFWRGLIEPKRIPRIIDATLVFPLVVAWTALKQGTILRSIKNVSSEIVKQFRNV
jgi:N-acetylglucosaminyldiphosphoundecaprenol N-acetyl-beta-D-mannosaminyltransferase